jgi:uncharacterized membrane-anchored protein
VTHPPRSRRWLLSLFTCVLAAMSLVQPAQAQQLGPDATGPANVTLKDGIATFHLPKGYSFIGPEKTTKLLNEKGGGASGNELGVVVKAGQDFAIFLSYSKDGYVEDKDADKIDANKILDSIKEGTESSNEKRKENGVAAMHVTGWSEAPHYDKARHVVVWAIEARTDGAPKPVVNYNTRMLGREGVLSVNLVIDSDLLAKNKPESEKIQNAIEFSQGKRYTDYKIGDKIAAGGLIALIAGGVLLKKAGILAFLFAFIKPILLGGWKLILIAVAAVSGTFKKLFNRNKPQPPPM